jgi:hypothetical protein
MRRYLRVNLRGCGSVSYCVWVQFPIAVSDTYMYADALAKGRQVVLSVVLIVIETTGAVHPILNSVVDPKG